MDRRDVLKAGGTLLLAEVLAASGVRAASPDPRTGQLKEEEAMSGPFRKMEKEEEAMSGPFRKMEIVGYADRMSVAPGDVVGVKVSCYVPGSYHADLVRVVSADRTAGGAGFEEHVVEASFAGEYEGKARAGNHGSHALVDPARLHALPNDGRTPSTLLAMIYPTAIARGRQGLCGTWQPGSGASLIIEEGELGLIYADQAGETRILRSGRPLLQDRWQLVSACLDPASGKVTLTQWPVLHRPSDRRSKGPQHTDLMLKTGLAGQKAGSFTFAGLIDNNVRPAHHDGDWVTHHYNGKLDRVRWVGRALEPSEIEALALAATPPADERSILGFWDFSLDIDSVAIRDIGPNGLSGRTVNLPARAVTGFNWDGSEHVWRHAPHQYGAIHFHDDDVHDIGWPDDFTFTVPKDLPSAIYAVRLRLGEHEYRIPLFVRASDPKKRASIAFVASTATYQAYANNFRTTDLVYSVTKDDNILDEVYLTLKAHPEFGLSMYDSHADGSGIQYSSSLRPMVDVQPGVSKCWTLQADLLVTAWMERSGFAFDIVTDDDLHRDGAAALDGYRLVITGSHPEYMSMAIRNAFDDHLGRGGRLIYLGGNGFYMRVAFNDKVPGAMEMRRVAQPLEGLWREAPGNHYFSFSGEPAGLWRNQYNPSNMSVGVGFANLMIGTELTFEATEAARSPRAKFLFEGISWPLRNDFGANYGPLMADEFDRYRPDLGSPVHALVVASAVRQAGSGPVEPTYQADMVFFETPSGGAVWSVSCISWGMGLNLNNRDNDISRVMANAINRMAANVAFEMPSA